MLDKKDIEWLNTQYPRLEINNNQLVGKIDFQCIYNDIELSDSYDIYVNLNTKFENSIPKIYETSQKIVNIAKFLNMNAVDLHLNTDSSLCLVIKDRENEYFEDKFTIQEYFENCIEPYLYWVSFYEKFGKAPWEEYAHGDLGFLELLAEKKISTIDIRNRIHTKQLLAYMYHYEFIANKCLCGKNKSMKKCHPLLFNALVLLKNSWHNKYYKF